MKVSSYFESNDEKQFAVAVHIQDKIKEFLTNSDFEPYANKYLEKKFREQYQHTVYFTKGILTMREKIPQTL